MMEKVLRPAFPDEPWSNQLTASLLNSMSDKYDIQSGKLISKGVLTRIEKEGSRTSYTLNEAERKRRDMEQADALIMKMTIDAKFAELRQKYRRQFQKEEAARQQEAKERKVQQQSVLLVEQSSLNTELANLKGLFTGKRRREIKARLKEVEQELAKLTDS